MGNLKMFFLIFYISISMYLISKEKNINLKCKDFLNFPELFAAHGF